MYIYIYDIRFLSVHKEIHHGSQKPVACSQKVVKLAETFEKPEGNRKETGSKTGSTGSPEATVGKPEGNRKENRKRWQAEGADAHRAGGPEGNRKVSGSKNRKDNLMYSQAQE